MSEYIRTNKFDTNECPNIFVKEKLIQTNVQINICDQYIRIYSNIFWTDFALCGCESWREIRIFRFYNVNNNLSRGLWKWYKCDWIGVKCETGSQVNISSQIAQKWVFWELRPIDNFIAPCFFSCTQILVELFSRKCNISQLKNLISTCLDF